MSFDDLAKRMAESQGKPFDASADPERLLAEADSIESRLGANQLLVLGVFAMLTALASAAIGIVSGVAGVSVLRGLLMLVLAGFMVSVGITMLRLSVKLRRAAVNPRPRTPPPM
ncbi:MAG TPA: hypothetical protein VGG74_17565 [Kofleriaceae bacterium]|jgi:hypothetical protein